MPRLHRRIPEALHGNRVEVVQFLQEELLDKLHAVVPVGGRIDWFGATAPDGFLLLTGQTLALPAYQNLADAGQSDIAVGATSITLPTIANKAIKY